MEEKESDLSPGMKSSGPTSADVSLHPAAAPKYYAVVFLKQVFIQARNYLEMPMSSLTILNSLKSEEKQWWPGNFTHSQVFKECGDKKGRECTLKGQNCKASQIRC